MIVKTKSEWEQIDKYKHNYQEVYCAFIDILGYKNKAELLFKNEYNLIERLDSIFHNINCINDMTGAFVDKNQKKVQVFSDSIIIVYPLQDDNLSKLLHDVALISAHCSMHDLFIRGGISFGKHIDVTTKNAKFNFLASEALQKAYNLEQCAKMPRILIDSKLSQNFTYTDMLHVIQNGEEYIVHFAPQLINEKGSNALDVYAEMKDIRDKLNAEQDTSVKEKYQWVLDYYYWTIECCSRGFDISKFVAFKPSKELDFKILDRS